MIVRVRYFASFRDHVGKDEDRLPLAEGTRVGQLWEDLARRVPHFAAFRAMPPAAVNCDYAEAARILRDGDEVAFLPPVAGG